MKKLIKTFCLLLFTVNVSCQVTQIVPLRTLSYDMPNGAYAKDLDNEFPFWIDTWEGVVNNKKYSFTFIKFTQHLTIYPNGSYKYEDVVVGKLKVTNVLTNQIIYNESNFTNYEDYLIKCLIIIDDEFRCGLYDKENHCYNSADFILVKDPNNPNQILYKDFSYDEYYECSTYQNQEDIPMFLPKVDLTLTRQ